MPARSLPPRGWSAKPAALGENRDANNATTDLECRLRQLIPDATPEWRSDIPDSAAICPATVPAPSALKRARASLQRRRAATADREPPPACDSPSEDAIVAKFVNAWESADLDALVALLTDDVFISMPPMPFEYEGRDVVARFCASLFRAGRRFDLVRTRANGQPAFGAYLRARGGVSHGVGLYVLSLTGDRICAMTRFDNSVLPWFGLPRSLPN